MANVIIQSHELLDWQQEVATSYIDDDYKLYVLNTSRQLGKSTLITQLILYSAINEDNAEIALISLTYKQVRLLYSKISEFLSKAPIVKSNNKSELLIELVNGSKIRFFSITNQDAIRGFTFTHMVADEAAYYPAGVWGTVLQPTLLVRGKKAVFISTPRGTQNDFYNLFQDGLNPQVKNTISYSYDYTHGIFDMSEIETIRKTIPDAIFKQEYMCQFSDAGSVFNNVHNIAVLTEWGKPIPGEKYVIGIDIGLYVDYTVATVMNSKGEVVEMYRERSGSILNVNQQLEKLIKRYNPIKVLIEVNNQGVAVHEYLHLKFASKIEAFKTTAQSKNPLINDLQKAIEERLISIPHTDLDNTYYSELNNFSFKLSPVTKTIQYQGLAGSHDDSVISLALTTKLFLEYMTTTKKPKMGYRIR